MPITKKLILLSFFIALGQGKSGNVNKRTKDLKTIVVHHGRVYGEIKYFSENEEGLKIEEPWMNPVACYLHIVDETYKQNVLNQLARTYFIKEVDFDRMLSIVTACENLQTSPDYVLDVKFEDSGDQDEQTEESPESKLSIYALFSGIVPGTKWCGVNDIAEHYRDLGEDFQLDKCCRAHDHCPIKIKAFSKNYGIMNYHPYTKSHCSCDELFYDCLKKVGDDKSSAVGNIFFNVLKLQCAQDYQPKYCVKYANGRPRQQVATKERRKRFLWKRFHSLMGTQTKEEECLEWQIDTTALPTFKFLSPNKYF